MWSINESVSKLNVEKKISVADLESVSVSGNETAYLVINDTVSKNH